MELSAKSWRIELGALLLIRRDYADRFVECVLENSVQKFAAEYGRYLTPGGYDFCWMFKDAARALTVGGKSWEECAKPIVNSDRATEKEHNLNALVALNAWLEKEAITEVFQPPSANLASPSGYVTVKLEPTFGCARQGHRFIIHTWNSQTLTLSRKVAGCRIHLIQQHLCAGDFADCIPAILDVRKRELFSARAVPPLTAALVSSELAWADSFFKTFSKAA